MATQTITLKVDVPVDDCYALLQKIAVVINGWKSVEADKLNHALRWKWGSHWSMKAPGTTSVSLQSLSENETSLLFTASNSALTDPFGILEGELKRLVDPFTLQVSALAEQGRTGKIRRPATPGASEGSESKMKQCPYCAEEIQEAAIVCKHCGRDLTTPAPASDLPARRAALEVQVHRYQAAGYRLVSAVDTMANLQRKAPSSVFLIIVLILLLWPAAIIYYATRKTYNVQLSALPSGAVAEIGGTLAEYERDRANASRSTRLWFGWILVVFGVLATLFCLIALVSSSTASDIGIGLGMLAVTGLAPLAGGILLLRSARKMRAALA
jgi:hypothetical protein